MKLFSEIYSTYYSITEKILKKRTVTKAEITDIIRQNGFSESVLFLEPKCCSPRKIRKMQKSEITRN